MTPNQANLPTAIPEILAREVLLARNLLATLQEEQKALKKMDVQLLSRTSKMKELLGGQLQELDAALRPAIAEFALTHGRAIPPDRELKLAEIIPFLPAQLREPASQQRQELATLRQEINTLNYINHRFTGETLRFLNDTIALVTRAANTQQPLYNPRGGKNLSYSRPSIFSKEV